MLTIRIAVATLSVHVLTIAVAVTTLSVHVLTIAVAVATIEEDYSRNVSVKLLLKCLQ